MKFARKSSVSMIEVDLFNAIKEKDYKKIVNLLNFGADLNAKDSLGRSIMGVINDGLIEVDSDIVKLLKKYNK